MAIGEYVTHAMQGGYVSESLQVGWPDAFNAFLRAPFHDCRMFAAPSLQELQVKDFA